MGEVDLARSQVAVVVDLSRVGVPSKVFDEILDMGYLLELAEHQVFQILLGLVLYRSSGDVYV
jgi:hypothetical protein